MSQLPTEAGAFYTFDTMGRALSLVYFLFGVLKLSIRTFALYVSIVGVGKLTVNRAVNH